MRVHRVMLHRAGFFVSETAMLAACPVTKKDTRKAELACIVVEGRIARGAYYQGLMDLADMERAVIGATMH